VVGVITISLAESKLVLGRPALGNKSGHMSSLNRGSRGNGGSN
jgi:hypothetical protein